MWRAGSQTAPQFICWRLPRLLAQLMDAAILHGFGAFGKRWQCSSALKQKHDSTISGQRRAEFMICRIESEPIVVLTKLEGRAASEQAVERQTEWR
jgi:hypothetical protein